jgi:hypothetical protein
LPNLLDGSLAFSDLIYPIAQFKVTQRSSGEPSGAKTMDLRLVAAQVLAMLGISDIRSQFCHLRFAI